MFGRRSTSIYSSASNISTSNQSILNNLATQLASSNSSSGTGGSNNLNDLIKTIATLNSPQAINTRIDIKNVDTTL